MRRTGKGYIKVIDSMFYNERKIREAVFAARNDIPRQLVGGGCGPGNPTENIALRNVSPLRFVTVDGVRISWPEDWLRVIDATRANFATDSDRYVILHDMYANVDYRHTCAVLSISINKLHKIRQEIRQYAALCAANLNLIRFV